ncbi:SDR family NAD(P)-dependent oxidoreductase [Aquiflexum lacus]|uniref:SDR family NAD(P)-dependent oxidoreductase n=1 Tax=Aquiflexum lacus TaxID=2483805 RepID=UPI00189488F1|nr:SDR family NAD(P)-dependent oxidoreductase [Aquiflexum lacus]
MSKTVFITGTSSGFGKAMVELFASKGWNVAATVRNKSEHADLFKGLQNVKIYELDISDYRQVNEVGNAVISDFKKIDVVVNNAAYCLMGPTETTTMEQIENQFKTNVFGLMAVSKAFIAHFREYKEGLFINIASSSARFNYPFVASYGGSKWAVRGISESLGIELKPFGIEVKTIYPGVHATRIFTKLDLGVKAVNQVYSDIYKTYFVNFLGAQSSVTNVTSPESIAMEVYKAAIKPKAGKLNIVSGGDAKMFDFMKKILPERGFQQQLLNSILNPISAGQVRMFKWILGKNIKPLYTSIPEELTK